MAHFDEGSSLAPPFNLVITPKVVETIFCNLHKNFSRFSTFSMRFTTQFDGYWGSIPTRKVDQGLR